MFIAQVLGTEQTTETNNSNWTWYCSESRLAGGKLVGYLQAWFELRAGAPEKQIQVVDSGGTQTRDRWIASTTRWPLGHVATSTRERRLSTEPMTSHKSHPIQPTVFLVLYVGHDFSRACNNQSDTAGGALSKAILWCTSLAFWSEPSLTSLHCRLHILMVGYEFRLQRRQTPTGLTPRCACSACKKEWRKEALSLVSLAV